MDAPNQAQLLLCALRHFGIDVEQSRETVFIFQKAFQISIEDDGSFLLHQKGEALGHFSDVVKLCTALQEKAMVKG
jgi:hypothetical protein